MSTLVTVMVVALASGVIARLLKLPPLVGFLVAGFGLHAAGVSEPESLRVLSDLGVTLLLFTIGLHFNVRALLRREVWGTALAHMGLTSLIGAGTVGMVAAVLGLASNTRELLVLGFALSFASTVLVMKELDERNDESSFYGTIAIGILLMQDIAAVVFMGVSKGEAPSPWALALLPLMVGVYYARTILPRLGHGELLILCGFVIAIVPGWWAFESVGLKGDLGALIMGLLLAGHHKSNEMARLLFGLKELLLVGFFLSIGFHGLPSWRQAVAALLVTAVLVLVKIAANVMILRWFGLANRTATRIALVLGNFSEFAIIVASIGSQAGWLSADWLVFAAVSVALSMMLATMVNRRGSRIIDLVESRLPKQPADRLHPGDQPIKLGRATALVLGMGRTGRGAYDRLDVDMAVVGIESDEARADHLRSLGYDVITADATDRHFWERVREESTVDLVVMAMPAHGSQEYAQRMLTASNFNGMTAAIAQYPGDVKDLRRLGVDTVINLYEGAGEQLVDEVLVQMADRNVGATEAAGQAEH